MLRMAIVGSRDYPQPFLVQAFVRRLAAREPVEVISGGARGVDTWAASEAVACGLTTRVYPADWDTLGKSAGIIRNSFLVRQANIVVAFWDLTSTGSRDSILKALRWGKPVKVFGPDGLPLSVDELSELLK